MNRTSRRELLLFAALLAVGVLGRLFEPAWNFTPLAAVGALAGYCFRGWAPAALLPLAVLAISDLFVDSHDNSVVQVVVYAMALLPLLLGRAARSSASWRQAAWWGACGVVPATAFYVVTNFAVWVSKSTYEPTLAGLADCYARALPFYRTMLAGDACYVALAAIAVVALEVRQRSVVTASI